MEPILRPQKRQAPFREECKRLLYGHPVKQILESLAGRKSRSAAVCGLAGMCYLSVVGGA